MDASRMPAARVHRDSRITLLDEPRIALSLCLEAGAAPTRRACLLCTKIKCRDRLTPATDENKGPDQKRVQLIRFPTFRTTPTTAARLTDRTQDRHPCRPSRRR